MEMTIARKVPFTAEGELAAMSQELIQVAGSPINRPLGAYVTMPGLGEYHRVRRTIQAWRRGNPQGYLIIAGCSANEKTFVEMTDDNLMGHFGLTRDELDQHRDRIIIQPNARNTPDQTDWLAHTLKEHNIKLAGLAVTMYHELRAFATLLASQRRLGSLELGLVVPRLIMVNPTDIVPETGVTYRDSAAGELKRMLTYVKKGDVATYDEFMSYMDRIHRAQLVASVW